MKVYIVERGCYSDRYVSGVFSSRELAEADIALHTDGERDEWNSAGDVTEYEVDEDAGLVKRPVWRSYIDLDSGEVYQLGSDTDYGKPQERSREPESHDCRGMANMSLRGWHFGRRYGETHSFISQEHAVKLAVEFRQAWLREQPLTH